MMDISKAILPTTQIMGLMQAPLDFAELLDEIPIGVLILDRNLRVVCSNRAFEALSGFSAQQSRGISCRHILRSRACILNCPALAMKRHKRPIAKDSDMVNTSRQRLPIRMNTAPIYDSDHHVVGYIETIEDIRHFQKAESVATTAYSFANIIGRSPQMEKIFQTLPMLAQSDASILITGETGTGKDLVAEAVHQTSERQAGPFIKINCGALPETLLESEIFGHQKGAFTGAVENKPGRFRLAHNGTIFLTEIGDLPLPLQVKLLTFLDDKIIYPLGSTKGFKADVRIIAATHRNLEQMVEQGRFRKDLLFRLNVARIHLPPLRKRDGDIRLLLDHFLAACSKQMNRKITGFSASATQILLNYSYEGNIRELKNIVEYAVNVTNKPLIESHHLPAYLTDSATTDASFLENGFPPEKASESDSSFFPSAAGKENRASLDASAWTDMQVQMILDALRRSGGKKGQAAKILGWGRSTLWRKMKQFGLDR